MGHDTFYIAAVKAGTPTHIALQVIDDDVRVISGPGDLEQIANHIGGSYHTITRGVNREFERDIPPSIQVISAQGQLIELEEIKSWDYIRFGRLLGKAYEGENRQASRQQPSTYRFKSNI